MLAAEYVQAFPRLVSLIAMPAPASISGDGYQVGRFPDGCVLKVGDRIVYQTPERDNDTLDLLAKVGRLLAGLRAETRAEQIRELGVMPRTDGLYNLRGALWTADGEFAGLA